MYVKDIYRYFFFFFFVQQIGYQGRIDSAFVSLKLGCVLCEDCAVCHYDILGRECSDVHAMQDHSKIPLFDPKQKPMEMSVSIIII